MKHLLYGVLAILCPVLCLSQIPLHGTVLSADKEPVAAATVTIKGSRTSTITASDGSFTLMYNPASLQDHPILLVTAVGYEAKELSIKDATPVTITLTRHISELDEALVIAYGKTTRRLNTGNITKITAAQIETQPVSNPLGTLAGRVPGLVVTQNSGVPGATFNIEIRGRSSLDLSLTRNDPLIIIDGVPFESGNMPVNQLPSAANTPVNASSSPPSGLSPLNTINPLDIESIEVLKDADATAIYGSRGANGVIMITTKKRNAAKTNIAVLLQTGISRVGRTMPMLNTSQYLAMRREAFSNDGITPTITNAPDLLSWDTTINNDFKKILVGGTANYSNVQASVSGGNGLTDFLLSANYNRQSTVFPGSFADNRGAVHLAVGHAPLHHKWDTKLSILYAAEKNGLFQSDLTRYLTLPPLIQLHDEQDQLNWQQKGINFSALGFANPLAELEKKYDVTNNNLIANWQLHGRILSSLDLSVSTGYNVFTTNETSLTPKAAIAPDNSTLAFASHASSVRSNWIIEPQLNYHKTVAAGTLSILAGSTFQQRSAQRLSVRADGYTSDLLLASLAAAPFVTGSNNRELYRYNAFFGRVNYNLLNKYILNFSGRRDGSSRFGPEKQFAAFAAMGTAWIFSQEKWFNKIRPLSFGKIRGSYGITGNDQVGDYKYLDLWTNTSNPYQGIPGLTPAGLFNPEYNWEKNKKWELALDLGFFQNRLMINTAYYNQRSSNQLVSYRLPNQSGFTTVIRNLPALVENSGWECVVESQNIRQANMAWSTSLNISIPQNRLINFPGLANSSYKTQYVQGEPLSVIYKIKFLGVDPATGVYQYADKNNDGKLTGDDRMVLGNTNPVLYGGLGTSFRYKKWNLECFAEFKKQKGMNYLSNLYASTPGFMYNQPSLVTDRWFKPGANASIQQFTTTAASPAFLAATYLQASDAFFSDASFVKLKTVSLSWTSKIITSENRIVRQVTIFLNAQNLFTFTGYKGADPETRNFFQLPPLKTVVGGIKINL